jgi:hypothetical protein
MERKKMTYLILTLTLLRLLLPSTFGGAHPKSGGLQQNKDARKTTQTRRESVESAAQRNKAQRSSPTPAACRRNPQLNGTIIQPELVTNWTTDQWNREFKLMTDACINQLVLQYTARADKKITFYPTKIPNYTMKAGYENMLDRLLVAADAARVDIYLGLQYEVPFSGSTPDQKWFDDEAAIYNCIADELLKKYGQQPGFLKHFKGWYLPLEVENLSYRNETSQDKLIKFYNTVADYLHHNTPGVPVITAPFFNANLSGTQDPSEWKAMWIKVLESAPIDVIALQDGVGALNNDQKSYHATTQQLPAWFKATREALDEASLKTGRKLQLWADTETYLDDYSTHEEYDFSDCAAAISIPQEIRYPLPVKRLTDDMLAVKDYVSNFIGFSFNHYMSPQQLWGNVYDTYTGYLASGIVEREPPSAAAHLVAFAESADSIRLSWDPSTDNIGVAGYHVYRNGEVVRTIYARGGKICAAYRDNHLENSTKYVYRVVAFDAAGNTSADSNTSTVETSSYDADQMVSLEKKYVASIPAMAPYLDVSGSDLTDGLVADEISYECWQGRNTDQKYSITVDLKTQYRIIEVHSDWLQKKQDFVFLPKKVRYEASVDGINYFDIGEVSRAVSSECVQSVKYSLAGLNVSARFLKMEVEPESGWSMTSEFEIVRGK